LTEELTMPQWLSGYSGFLGIIIASNCIVFEKFMSLQRSILDGKLEGSILTAVSS
jgi:hypothetical protein